MSRIKDLINTELETCFTTVSGILQQTDDTLHRLIKDPQADDDDRKAYGNAIVRVQKVRNGLHG